MKDRFKDIVDTGRKLMTRKNKWALVTVAATFLVIGCIIAVTRIGNEQEVIVVDGSGTAVAGANVVSVSLSMNTLPAQTDDQGKAKVPYNIQGTKCIIVSKPGYESLHVDVPKQWPLRVTLKKSKASLTTTPP